MYSVVLVIALVGAVVTKASAAYFASDDWSARETSRRSWTRWLSYVLVAFLVLAVLAFLLAASG
ncbi:hypothetical protein acdb102_27170 [Acidothermaceae bacterium B102]|nr:hypothetical protein acdb102_27170 [Acidothermaceae bacterium B102]